MIPKGNGQFWGKHLPDKPNTPNNCELNWSMQQHMTGRRLIASVGLVCYRPRSGNCTPQAKSDNYDCLVKLLLTTHKQTTGESNKMAKVQAHFVHGD